MNTTFVPRSHGEVDSRSDGDVVPLCVDLDGTLLRTDSLLESIFALLKLSPWSVFLLPVWLVSGRARLKENVAVRAALDPGDLPYRQEFVDWVRIESAARPVIMVTAAHRLIADRVAAHVGCFDDVMATDGLTNLKGRAKAASLVERFGAQGFDYAGDDDSDVHIWTAARGAILVGASAALETRVRDVARVVRVFEPRGSLRERLRSWVKALRVYQWAKNLLVFLAPAAAHVILRPAVLKSSLVAFVAFCLAASAIYLVNDLLDLAADRRHARKRRRPFASGALPLSSGMLVAGLLLAAAFVLAFVLNFWFAAVLASYVVTTTLYSFWIKTKTFLDVATLAALYTVRVVGGAFAVNIGLSFWLLAVCLYAFLGLALLKRYSELVASGAGPEERIQGRGYIRQDMPVVLALGVGCSLLATLVTALYIDSQSGQALYARPGFLWGIVGLMVLGVGRLWSVASRGGVNDDPIVYIARDEWSLALIALAVVFVALAVWH